MNIVFFGTPNFAVPSLNVLVRSKHNVRLVVTQPDKRKGRSKKLGPPPVKEFAEKNYLKVLQPENIKDEEFLNSLGQLDPDVIVVVAYGKILPPDILRLPKWGCINIHASLLPKYRGAAPIQWAIINGEKESGVTTMLMDEGLDTGQILLTKIISIYDSDTYESLSLRLSTLGAEVLLETLEAIEKNEIHPSKQKGTTSYARPLKKEDGLVDWSKSARDVYNFIRGLYPWPCAYTFINGERVKIIKALPVEGKGVAGRIIIDEGKNLLIGTSNGLLSIIELQPEGKKPMTSRAYLSGRREELKMTNEVMMNR